jgi:ABC-type antimicrobial peptide transport system permease subunit
VIVSEMFAKQSWPRQDAVRKRMRLLSSADGAPRGAPPVPGPWLTVVGVVPDILQDDESFEMSAVIYMPFRQHPMRGPEFVVRTRVPPATVTGTIRQEVQALDADLAVRTLRSLEESFWLRNWRYRVFGTMFAIFAMIALVLACVGLYAVIAQAVSQRTREIGVRMTLGATSAMILRLIFGHGMLQLALGLVVGLAGALAATQVLSAMLVGVTASDPLTFGVVVLLLTIAGALGCAIPARRAMHVDPVIALRNE